MPRFQYVGGQTMPKMGTLVDPKGSVLYRRKSQASLAGFFEQVSDSFVFPTQFDVFTILG